MSRDLPTPRSATTNPYREFDRPDRMDQVIHARYDFWIETLTSDLIGPEQGVYLSTFQRGKGQHITVLDTRQARGLGERLIALAEEIEVGAVAPVTGRALGRWPHRRDLVAASP